MNFEKEPSASRRVLFRADASARIGLGHVMRCLSLASRFVEGGWEVMLVSTSLPSSAAERAEELQVSTVDFGRDRSSSDDASAVGSLGADLVVVDGYEFDTGFFATLESFGSMYAILDDNGDTRAIAPSIIVNQNPHATASMYEHMVGRPELLLGLDYVLLREEIRNAAQVATPTKLATRVFVSMGGSDPVGLTAPVSAELAGLGIRPRVALGEANAQLHSAVQACSASGAVVIRPEDFVSELAMADVAIVGAGSTLWEAAYLGVPTVGVIVADNQRGPAVAAADLGFVTIVDADAAGACERIATEARQLLSDSEGRSEMSRLGRSSVDGLGVERVMAVLERKNGGAS